MACIGPRPNAGLPMLEATDGQINVLVYGRYELVKEGKDEQEET